MNRLLVRSATITLPIAAALSVLSAAPVGAHERRTTGAFQLVVGWGDEPSYTGFKNSVQVTITEANGGPAVTDITDSLKVEVSKGSDRTTIPLVANFRVGSFGAPGDYRAWLTPTRPGTYTFRFTGTVRGQNVDESFTSSRATFNDVEDVANIEFPVKDPTTGQLSTRIDREVPRLEAGVQRAEARADDGRALALVGVVLGALGLAAAAGALIVVMRNRGGRAGRGGPGLPVSEMARPDA